MTAVVAPRG